MSKNIQNEEMNEGQSKSQKGYSLRERTSSKKNVDYMKLSFEGESNSLDSGMLKKKRRTTDYSTSSNVFECSFDGCKKKFYDRSAFHKHQLTHGDKLFTCNDCGKKFLDNSKLRRHSLVHTGEKPYKCDICNKRFSLDFNLRTHMRIHTGEKPYACTYPGCFKRFSQSSNLNAHEKTHELTKENMSQSGANYGEYLIYQNQQRPIFAQNPLKFILFNQFSGTMTLNNLFEINKLYEMLKEGINNQLNINNGYNVINKNFDEKSKNSNRNIILDKTYNKNEPIKKTNSSQIQGKKKIFGVFRKDEIFSNSNNPYNTNNFISKPNYIYQNQNNNYYEENVHVNNIFEEDEYNKNNNIKNYQNEIENQNNNNEYHEGSNIEKSNYINKEKNDEQEKQTNAPQVLNQYQEQEEFDYNHENSKQNKEEERNESENENEEGDGYFKRIHWEN